MDDELEELIDRHGLHKVLQALHRVVKDKETFDSERKMWVVGETITRQCAEIATRIHEEELKEKAEEDAKRGF